MVTNGKPGTQSQGHTSPGSWTWILIPICSQEAESCWKLPEREGEQDMMEDTRKIKGGKNSKKDFEIFCFC